MLKIEPVQHRLAVIAEDLRPQFPDLIGGPPGMGGADGVVFLAGLKLLETELPDGFQHAVARFGILRRPNLCHQALVNQ